MSNNLINEELDPLDELDDLFTDLSIDGPTKDQLWKMYGIFLNDFVKTPLYIKGIKLNFNRNLSKHPVCKGKPEGFEHIITRENNHSKKRNFDPERANKVHWIRPMIENVDDIRIKYFERINEDGYNQKFYWYEEKRFIIIIREINPDLMLITAFLVDYLSEDKYKKWYYEY